VIFEEALLVIRWKEPFHCYLNFVSLIKPFRTAQVVEPAVSDSYTTMLSELVSLEGFGRALHLKRMQILIPSHGRKFGISEQVEVKKQLLLFTFYR